MLRWVLDFGKLRPNSPCFRSGDHVVVWSVESPVFSAAFRKFWGAPPGLRLCAMLRWVVDFGKLRPNSPCFRSGDHVVVWSLASRFFSQHIESFWELHQVLDAEVGVDFGKLRPNSPCLRSGVSWFGLLRHRFLNCWEFHQVLDCQHDQI